MCARDTYKPLAGAEACTPCPSNTGTDAPGAIDSGQCRCRGGYISTDDNDDACTLGAASRLIVGNLPSATTDDTSPLGRGADAWDGQAWVPVGEAASTYESHVFAVYKGALHGGGVYRRVGELVPHRGVARWSGQVWDAVGAEFEDGLVRALAVFDGDLYAGGEFLYAGTPAAALARWDAAAGVWAGVGGGLGGVTVPTVAALAVYAGELYVGGIFERAGTVKAHNIARWNGTAWRSVTSGVFDGFNGITSLAVWNGVLYVGGDFPEAGGVSAPAIAQWNGTAWAGVGAPTFAVVLALGVVNGTLVAAGLSAPDDDLKQAIIVARWTGTVWAPLGGPFADPLFGSSAAVRTLGVYNGTLFAGGEFTVPADRIAQWTGIAWAAVGGGLPAPVLATTTWCTAPCVPCPRNTYGRQGLCKPCPPHSHTDSEGAASCTCDHGWTGPHCNEPVCEEHCAVCRTPECRACGGATPPPPVPPPRARCQRVGDTAVITPAIAGAVCLDLYSRQYNFLTSAGLAAGVATTVVPDAELHEMRTLIIEGYADAGCTVYLASRLCYLEADSPPSPTAGYGTTAAPPASGPCRRLADGGVVVRPPAAAATRCVILYDPAYRRLATVRVDAGGMAVAPASSVQGQRMFVVEVYRDAGCTDYDSDFECAVVA